MNEIEIDAFYRAKAIEYIYKNKLQSLKMYALKVMHYFNYRDELKTKSESSSAKDIVMLLTYGPLLILFAIRLAFIRRYKLTSFEVLVYLLYISNAFIAAMFFTRIRYRLPFDFLLIANVAIFIDLVIRKRLKEEFT